VRVTYRADGKEKEVKDPSWIDKAMDATADALVEVADKAEDVGDGAKRGAREAADKAEDVGDAAKKGAREAADKAEDVGDAAKKGAKKAGRKIKKAVKPD
jgi:methyl-accepting chemotaxis protein